MSYPLPCSQQTLSVDSTFRLDHPLASAERKLPSGGLSYECGSYCARLRIRKESSFPENNGRYAVESKRRHRQHCLPCVSALQTLSDFQRGLLGHEASLGEAVMDWNPYAKCLAVAGVPGCDAVGACRPRDPEIARSEVSASTSDHVQFGVRIITEGPIAPDRPSNEVADSRRASGRVPSRSAISRHAEAATQTGMPATATPSVYPIRGSAATTYLMLRVALCAGRAAS